MRKLLFGISLLIIGVSLYFVFDHIQNKAYAIREAISLTELSPSPIVESDFVTLGDSAPIIPETSTSDKITKGISIFDALMNSIQKLFAVISAGVGLYFTIFEVKKKMMKRKKSK